MPLYPFTLNNVQYNLSDFQNLSYVTGLPSSMANAVLEPMLLSRGTSSSSVTIGTGAKSLTTATGLKLAVGQCIFVCTSGNPSTQRMYGTVTSYNASTGTLNFNSIAAIGSGTFTSWYVGVGGVQGLYSATDHMLAIDNGGTGFGRDTFVKPAAFLGLNEPSMHMREIYEDFTGSQGAPTDTTANPQTNPPWIISGNSASHKLYPNPQPTPSILGVGVVALVSPAVRVKNRSAVLQYGRHGFLHVGRGACAWEARVHNLSDTSIARFGLRCDAKDYAASNIFRTGGLGFSLSPYENNGNYVLVGGGPGEITRVFTAVTPVSSNWFRFRIVVDHDGRIAQYYINGVLVGTITVTALSDFYSSLMTLSFEAESAYMHIDYVYLRKYLLR